MSGMKRFTGTLCNHKTSLVPRLPAIVLWFAFSIIQPTGARIRSYTVVHCIVSTVITCSYRWLSWLPFPWPFWRKKSVVQEGNRLLNIANGKRLGKKTTSSACYYINLWHLSLCAKQAFIQYLLSFHFLTVSKQIYYWVFGYSIWTNYSHGKH